MARKPASGARPALRTIDDWLAHIKTLELPRDTDEVRRVLALDRAGAGVAIASAARLIAEAGDHTFAPELVAAFQRLVGHERDPGCRGKIAIARCLHDIDQWEEAVFVGGQKIVQREGFEQVDTAGGIRAICALAHAHFLRPDALDVIAELLADKERTTREGAARALGDLGQHGATALLRYVLLTARDDPEVYAACCESLLAISRESASFLCELLVRHDDRGEAAALALGGARIATARDTLIRWCADAGVEQRHRVGYLAVALLRDEAANRFLVEVITTRDRKDSFAAAKALATFKEDPGIASELAAAAKRIKDAGLRRDIEALL